VYNDLQMGTVKALANPFGGAIGHSDFSHPMDMLWDQR
jgi:hypothetical protein